MKQKEKEKGCSRVPSSKIPRIDNDLNLQKCFAQ